MLALYSILNKLLYALRSFDKVLLAEVLFQYVQHIQLLKKYLNGKVLL